MEPWLDEEDIDPGWEWEPAIEDAIAKTDVMLICCSPRSVNKEGFFLEEVSKALKLSVERPDSIFLVPVRLEDCKVLIELGRLQWADLHKTGGIDRLTTSLTRRAKRLGLAG